MTKGRLTTLYKYLLALR